MRAKPLAFFGSFLLLALRALLSGQESRPQDLPPALKERAVVLDIVARVIEQNREEVLNSVNSKVTIPGRPVGIKLIGANIVVAVQFTPYQQGNGRPFLLAQGQIWIDIPNQGISYQTAIETIPLEYGEPVYFFPLGSNRSAETARIEIRVALHPYTEKFNGEKANPAPAEQPVPGGPDHDGPAKQKDPDETPSKTPEPLR
jgi:hypothetical protein